MRITIAVVLLIAATICFVAAALGWGRGIPIGLACFSGAFLAAKL